MQPSIFHFLPWSGSVLRSRGCAANAQGFECDFILPKLGFPCLCCRKSVEDAAKCGTFVRIELPKNSASSGLHEEVRAPAYPRRGLFGGTDPGPKAYSHASIAATGSAKSLFFSVFTTLSWRLARRAADEENLQVLGMRPSQGPCEGQGTARSCLIPSLHSP